MENIEMNTTQRIMTPEEFIIRAVNEYPSLYASPSYDETKFRILDHAFNTLGSGITRESFIGNPVSVEEVDSAKKWFCCERAAYGYLKFKTIGEKYPNIVFNGDSNRLLPDGYPVCVARVDEKEKYPHIKYWLEFDCNKQRIPYPSFFKKYSTVWDDQDIEFPKLGKEWAQAAVWFYSKCKEFFLDSDRVKNYSYAFPKFSEKETKDTIDKYKESFTLESYDTNEDITKAYKCEFTGDRNKDEDVAEFLTRVWNKKHQRILDFLDETIAYLNQLIENPL